MSRSRTSWKQKTTDQGNIMEDEEEPGEEQTQ